MPTLLLFAPEAARRAALLEQLTGWEELTVQTATTAAEWRTLRAKGEADAGLVDAETLPEPPTPDLRLLQLTRQKPEESWQIQCPVRWHTLAGRLSLLLGRAEAEEPFDVGPYRCLPLERVLLRADESLLARLTDKEVDLLATLAASPMGVDRSALLAKVWGYRDDLETHTLETHIYRLRQKLEANPVEPQVLLTIEGGYKLAERASS